MKARKLATLTALSLTSLFGATAHAAEPEEVLAWQQSGYVTDVIVVTAPRPETLLAHSEDLAAAEELMALSNSTLAWQEPGYVEEVVVVTASRSEVLAEAGWTEESPRIRRLALLGTPAE